MGDAVMHVIDEGAGPAVVLLHAYPCDATMWDAQAQALLDAGYRVLRPDLPGFGSSAVLPGEPSLGAVAAVVLEAIDSPTFALAGLSMGGYIAMQILRQQPERVTALALFDTKAGADPEPARATRYATAETAQREGGIASLADAMLPGLLGAYSLAKRPEVVSRVRGYIARASGDGAAWAMRAMAVRPDSFELLRAFSGPAVVVMGEEDALSPLAEHQAMAEALPNGRLVTIPRAGHLSALEDPEAVSGALLDLLRG